MVILVHVQFLGTGVGVSWSKGVENEVIGGKFVGETPNRFCQPSTEAVHALHCVYRCTASGPQSLYDTSGTRRNTFVKVRDRVCEDEVERYLVRETLLNAKTAGRCGELTDVQPAKPAVDLCLFPRRVSQVSP